MENLLIVTQSMDVLKRYLDPSAIAPLAHNAAFAFDYGETPAAPVPRLYVVKTSDDNSIEEALVAGSGIVGEASDIAALRTLVVNEKLFAAQRAEEGDQSFQLMQSCFTDRAFTGLVIGNLGVQPLRESLLGPASLVRSFAFAAPFVAVSNIDFSGSAPDLAHAHVSGYLVGTPTEGAPRVTDLDHAGFTLDFARLVALFADDDVTMAKLACYVHLRTLFSVPVRTDAPLVLAGTYSATASAEGAGIEAYRFQLVTGTHLYFSHQCLHAVSITRAASTFAWEGGAARLRLSCEGTIQFAAPTRAFDALSYGPAAAAKDAAPARRASPAETSSALAFSGLELTFDLPPSKPALQTGYRSIALDGRASAPRAGSFAAGVPHRDLWFLCDQDGGTPEELGYQPLSAPFGTGPIEQGKPWYGIVFAVDLIAGSSAEFLFAFAAEGSRYCGVRLAGAAGAAGALLPASSFFNLRFREVAADVDAAEGAPAYRIILRGLKAAAMGMQLPEGACDIALVAKDGETGWYAAYDPGQKE